MGRFSDSPPGANEAGASLRARSVELSRDTHVRKPCPQVRIHEDVLGLDVAVDDDRLAPRPRLRLVKVLQQGANGKAFVTWVLRHLMTALRCVPGLCTQHECECE